MNADIFDRPESDMHTTLQEQVRRHVRSMVVSGRLTPGQQLPSVHELAKRWQTNVRTVHLALRALVREGLLTSVPRVGTYVGKPEEKLTRVGIVHSRDVFAPGGSEFVHSIHNQLRELLEARGIEVSVWVDSRPQAQQDSPWEALRSAAAERKIQAMIVPALTWQRMEWMEKLPIPSAYLTMTLVPNSVHLDKRQFIDLSLERLVAQGCRSVGFLYHSVMAPRCPGREIESVPSLVGRFIDRATDLGLEVRNEWVRLQKTDAASASRQFGYNEFRELWAAPRRPEGLVVSDDIVMRGAITAILEAGVRVPGKLKVVSAKNKHVELFSPFPISHVVADEREIAQALIEQVQIQFRGDRCGVSPKWIGYTLDTESASGK